MMENMKQINTEPMEYDYLKASSSQDCTGLIPRAINDESEIENYKEVYPFLPKVIRPDDLSSEPE